MNKILIGIIIYLFPFWAYSQNGVKWCVVSDTNYNAKLTLVGNDKLLKNVSKEVDNEHFAIYNDNLYYITSNNHAVVRYNLKNRSSSVIGRSNARSYTSLNINNRGVITLIGYENNVPGRRYYNIVNDKILAIQSAIRSTNIDNSFPADALTFSDTIVSAGTFTNSLLRVTTTSGELLPLQVDYTTYPTGFPVNSSRLIYFNVQLAMQDSQQRRFAIMVGEGNATIKLFTINDKCIEKQVEVVVDSCLLPFSVLTNNKGEPWLGLMWNGDKGLSHKICALDIACSSNRFYLLYSDRNSVPYLNSSNNQGNIIYEFDWNGNLINCYKIEKYLCNLMYDYATKRVYGVSRSAGYYLQLFELTFD